MEKSIDHMSVIRRPLRSGHSLLELTIVVLVLGIMAAVAGPKFGKAIAQARVESVAQRIAADLNYARRVAMLNSRTCTVQFTTSPAAYQMIGVVHPDHPHLSYAVQLAGIDSGVRFQSISFNGEASVSYNNYGRPLAGSPIGALTSGSVRVNLGNEQATVSIDPTSGEAATP